MKFKKEKSKDNKKTSTFPFKVINFSRFNIERILLVSMCACFAILIISQLLMTNPEIRVLLTRENEVEGVFLEKSSELYTKGILILSLDNVERADSVWVLVNGEKAASFSQRQLTIAIKDDDLIEIDGSNCKEKVKIKVDSYSENVDLVIDNSILEVNGNIGVLARAKLMK